MVKYSEDDARMFGMDAEKHEREKMNGTWSDRTTGEDEA